MSTVTDIYETFPRLSDPLFAQKITHMEEFRELKLSRNQEDTGSDGIFLANKLGERLFSKYSTVRKGLAIHYPGTGKSCYAAVLAEAHKHELIGPGKNKALVVVPGNTLEDSFKENLAYVCTKNVYTPAPTGKTLNAASIRGQITNKINKYYEIDHYQSLSKKVRNTQMSDQAIIDTYSDRVIILDEAHRLRMGYIFGDSKRMSSEEKEMQDAKVYETIHRIVHTAQRIILVLLTASPITDDPREFTLLANLLVPIDRQFPMNFDWTSPEALPIAEELLRGRITFVMSSSDVAMRIHKGQDYTIAYSPTENLILNLYPSYMDSYQWNWYSKNINKGEVTEDLPPALFVEEIAESEGKRSNAFRIDERYASNFVFQPLLSERTGSYLDKDLTSMSAFNKRVFVDAKTGNYGFTDVDTTLRDTLSTPALFKKSSMKFYNIVQEIMQNPTQVAYCYTSFVKGPGAILLGLALECNGYQRWSGESFNGTSMPEKKKRYMIVTGYTPTSEIRNALDFFRNPANCYGEYMQVLIGSRVTGEGMTFKNVRQYHYINPDWNDTPGFQAENRGLREGSHKALREDERIYNISRHASFPPPNVTNVESIDFFMYKVSEIKRKAASTAIRMLKQICVNCLLAKDRNQIPGTDYTRDCDYSTCLYKCYGSEVDVNGNNLPPIPIDDTNYFLHYSGECINKIKDEITKFFVTRESATTQEIYNSITFPCRNFNDPLKYINKACAELIRDSIPITDEFGRTSYLRMEQDTYFLQPEPFNTSIGSASYSHNLIVSKRIPFNSIVTPLQTILVDRKVEEIMASSEQDNNFWYKVFYNTFKVRAKLLEMSLSVPAEDRSAKHQFIIDLFTNRHYQLNRTVNGTVMTYHFHDILTRDGLDTYNMTVKTLDSANNIRWMDPVTRQWYFVEDDNFKRQLFEKMIADDAARLEKYKADYYGILSSDDENFRIVNKAKGNRATTDGTTDRRSVSRGTICKDRPKEELAAILAYFNLEPNPFPLDVNRNPSKEELHRYWDLVVKDKSKLPSAYTPDEVRRLVIQRAWYNFSNNDVCQALLDFFRQNNLLHLV